MALNQDGHVMLSYNWNSKSLVSEIYKILVDRGIKTWMDINGGMGDEVNSSMAQGVENAAVVCCFMTPDYQKSENCRLELVYAKERKKRIIPCLVGDKNDEKWKPSEWLGLIIAGLNYIKFRDNSEANIRLRAEELIARIRNQPPPQPTKSASKTIDFFAPIRDEYIRDSYIQRMMNEEKSFPIEKSYINLAIVETEEQGEKEKKLRQISDGIIGTFEEIYGTKTIIDVKNIFAKCNDRTKKVLVLGRAGIGKSTFLQYVTYQWAKGEIWSQYQLLLLIRLRLLTSSRYPPGHNYSPIDIVKKEYFSCDTIPEEDKRRFKELCGKGQVFWLLDGYDEFAQNIPEQLRDVFDHIRTKQHHILTSRPYSIPFAYDSKMEITGFTNDNIVGYVQLFFDQIKDQMEDASSNGQKLLSFLKSNPSIWGVAHIPVNIELICSLWNDMDRSEARILTMTGLYDNMTEWLCRRYLTRQQNLSIVDIEAMFKDDVYEQCKKELSVLETLAFNAMNRNTLILQPSLYEKALKDSNATVQDTQHILNMGILKSLNTNPTGNQGQTKRDYYFVHLSFQEHFAARYLINTLSGTSSDEAINFIKSNKYNQRFTLVFTFASGLLTSKNATQCLNTFWNTLLGEPLDLMGFRHMQLHISCIEEVSEITEVHRRAELIDSLKKWIKYVVSTKCNTVYDQLANSLQRNPSLLTEQTIIDQVTELLQSSSDQVKVNTCVLISIFSTYSPQLQFLDPLVVALGDEKKNVRMRACDAIGQMGRKAATREVISKLESALENNNWDVRRNAWEALEKIGETAATNKLINKLVSALGDENNDVRRNACEVLGQIGEKAATNEVISKLIDTFEDPDENVGRNACEAFGQMGERTVTSDVISKLVSALEDDRHYVRRNACVALGKMSEKAATSEVISKLVSALEDDNEHVRMSAWEALDQMGEKAANDEVINKLVSALGDHDEEVRSNACKALSQMGEKATTDEVINEIVSALDDDHSVVRNNACKALGQIGERAATTEVISKLVSALEDNDVNVRASVWEALGHMGGKAVTSEVISKLVSAVQDDYWGVRTCAWIVLGQMGEKAEADGVINQLLSALEDDGVNIRMSACQALGKMGENAATSEVISKLANALGDDDVNVKMGAWEAFIQMGEKVATSEVIRKLVGALEDDYEYVRSSACEFVIKMGEKAATREVIEKLIRLVDDKASYVRFSACRALERSFTSFEIMIQLDSDTVMMLSSCLERGALNDLSGFAPDALIRVFLHSKNSVWLPVITQVTLLQGGGVTITENTIVVYGSKEAVMLDGCDRELLRQLVNAFVEQAKKYDLPCARPTEAQVLIDSCKDFISPSLPPHKAEMASNKSSSACNVI